MFRWGIALAVILALALGGYLYLRLDDEIRRYAEQSLANKYPQLNVSVGSARFSSGSGVTLYDLKISDSVVGGMSVPLLEVDSLTLNGDFELQNLASGKQNITGITVRRPRLSAIRDANGKWNISRLVLPPQANQAPPPVTFHDATIVLRDQTKPNTPPLTIQHANLSFAAVDNPRGGPQQWTFQGDVADTHAKSITVQGNVTPENGALQLSAEVKRLLVDRERLLAVPGVPAYLLAGVEAEAAIDAKANISLAHRDAPLVWSGEVHLTGGMFKHLLAPWRVTELSLDAEATQDHLYVTQLAGKCGGAEFSVACNRKGWQTNAPLAMNARVSNLPLDQKMYQLIPASLKKHWIRFRPAGNVDAAITASFDGQRWLPDATVNCRGVSFEDREKFPYRLTNAVGAVRLTDRGDTDGAKLIVDLLAQGENRPIHIRGELKDIPLARTSSLGDGQPPLPPAGWLEITGESLRVTEAMLAALPDKAQSIAAALNPQGEFSAYWRMERVTSDQEKPFTSLKITSKNGSLKYDKFPYPIRHLTGTLNEENGRWWFENLTAADPNGPQVVTATGSLEPVGEGHLFKMKLGAQAAALDAPLRASLPLEVQRAWDELRPRGRIDFSVDVTHATGDAKPTLRVDMRPNDRDLSLDPNFFPYRLEAIDGRFLYENDRIQFTGVRAQHGRTQIETAGGWQPLGDGGWQFDLSNLSIDRLDADRDFRLAAPLELRKVIAKLAPEGSFDLHNSALRFIRRADPQLPLLTQWNVQLFCQQADFNLGVRIEDATGSVQIAGQSDGIACQTQGELRLDSLFWNNLQLTDLRGPIWCDRQQCLLGEGASFLQNQNSGQQNKPRRLVAKTYGGVVDINSRVLFETQPRYNTAINFRGVDLPRFMADYANNTTPVTGKIEGQLELGGVGSTVYGLQGKGDVHLVDANLYELPQLVSMLKVLRNRTPDTTAFNRCDAEFTLQGEHVLFQKLDLLGDAVSLYGRGEASFDKKIQLAFHSIVGRNELAVPLLKSFVGQASEQLMQIHVDGTIDNPNIRRETLPLVGNVVRQIQRDLQPRALTSPAAIPGAAALRR